MESQPNPQNVAPSENASADDASLSKAHVSALPLNLANLVAILERAYKTLKDIHQANLILAVGNTGCGKSTMLTSLMFGTDALEEKKIEYEIDIPKADGSIKKKKKNKTVIDQRPLDG